MSSLFVDYTNGSMGNKTVKYSGGGDFTRFVLEKLDSSARKDEQCDRKIIILWPKGKEIVSPEDKRIRETYSVIEVNSLIEVNYNENDVIFLPLLDSFNISIVKHINALKNHPRVYGVLHGLRLLDMTKYDKYDKYYYSGIKSLSIVLWVRRWIAAAIAKQRLKECLPLLDRVYTVSNNSMQLINHYGTTSHIKYFTRYVMEYKDDSEIVRKPTERFILFISSNRYEKNFIRSLVAFCSFQKRSNEDIKLYVLGMKSPLREKLNIIPGVTKDILESKVVFFDYIPYDQVLQLYANCEFLLYTSKSEGFGLPPLEALNAGRPSVCSKTTSVPEVLGMSAYYVDPYNVEDIASGIEFMSIPQNQDKYVKMIQALKPLIYERGTFDIQCLVSELLHE